MHDEAHASDSSPPPGPDRGSHAPGASARSGDMCALSSRDGRDVRDGPSSSVRRRPFKPTVLRPQSFYYTMAECAAALGWSVIRTKRQLRGNGRDKPSAIVKRRGRWYTTKGLLRRALPEEAYEFIARLDEVRERSKRDERKTR